MAGPSVRLFGALRLMLLAFALNDDDWSRAATRGNPWGLKTEAWCSNILSRNWPTITRSIEGDPLGSVQSAAGSFCDVGTLRPIETQQTLLIFYRVRRGLLSTEQ
jgi:hypothetical protein